MIQKTIESVLTFSITEEDIDTYGHLNNIKACEYFQKGRLTLQEKIGYPEIYLVSIGIGLFVHKSEYKYKRQAYEGDKIDIISSFSDYDNGPKIEMRQKITTDIGTIATANLELAFFDLKEKKLIASPPKYFTDAMYEHIDLNKLKN